MGGDGSSPASRSTRIHPHHAPMKRRTALLILIPFTIPLPVPGQEAPEPMRLFLSAGAGVGSHGTLHGSLSVSDRTGEYLLRGVMGFDLAFGGFPGGDFAVEGFTRELSELALLYGRRARRDRGWVRVALGVGRTAIAEPDPVGPGEEPTTSAFGLAGQAGFAWAPSRSFGFGLTGVGNLNELRSFGAVTLGVHVGRVR